MYAYMRVCVWHLVIIQGDAFYSPVHASILSQQYTSHDTALSLITTTTHNGHFTKQSGEKSNFSKRLSYPLKPQIKRVCVCVIKRFITFKITRVEEQTERQVLTEHDHHRVIKTQKKRSCGKARRLFTNLTLNMSRNNRDAFLQTHIKSKSA